MKMHIGKQIPMSSLMTPSLLLQLSILLTLLTPILTLQNWVNEQHTAKQDDFICRWKLLNKTIFNGSSVQELLDMCPNGCDADKCSTFPVKAKATEDSKSPPATSPCTDEDIEVLRKAQEMAKSYKHSVNTAKEGLFVHTVMTGIIFGLIVLLILRGHYRVRDLWWLPTERQWEKERDPTWGLPGKVWSLLRIRVVKSDNKEPTDRKYQSYTENPTVMGDKFWSYKHGLRDMYKTHKYYKRNRYFHKLAWQVTKLNRIIPETLRRHKTLKRRAGEVEKVRRPSSPPPEQENHQRLPWAVDLPDELNTVYLRKAKEILVMEQGKLSKHFINGRYQPNYHHHHHHHHHPGRASRRSSLNQQALTFEEMKRSANEMETDPFADFVMVDGVMKMKPNMKMKQFHHHHHHHRRHRSI